MTHDFEPQLVATLIASLRPTQMTVGMREVARKRAAWREQGEREPEFLGRHVIPVVLGPHRRPWMVDHHHLVIALHQEGERHVLTSTIADLSKLPRKEFMTVMDNRSWLHPYDADGLRCSLKDLPKSIENLADDPYRSLAGEVRRAGGYAKSTVPFTEFLWADFFRRRIKPGTVERDFDSAATRALTLARSPKAQHLPGWAGPEASARAETDAS